MQELEVTFKRFAAIAWVWCWRVIFGGAVLGGVAGFIVGLTKAVLRIDQSVLPSLAGNVGTIAGMIWSFFALRLALEKPYKGFRIALVSLEAEAPK